MFANSQRSENFHARVRFWISFVRTFVCNTFGKFCLFYVKLESIFVYFVSELESLNWVLCWFEKILQIWQLGYLPFVG